MKNVIGGLVCATVGAVITVYTLACLYSWKTSGMQDYVRAHRRDKK